MKTKVSFENVVCIRATPKAILCRVNDEELWFPLSQVDDDSEVFDAEEHNEGTLIVSEWICKEKGLYAG